MESVTMEQLLKAEEEKIRGEIKADTTVDKSREQTVARLREALGQTLLRYNAANSGDMVRQGLADCLTATAQDSLGYLLTGTAEKEISRRPVRAGAVISLLCAVIACLGGALFFVKEMPLLYDCILMAVSVLLAFLAGRLWYGEREVRVHAGLDADAVWRTLKKTSSTMDRKITSFYEMEEARIQEAQKNAEEIGTRKFNDEELQLLGDLLEGLYSDNGEFSLRQLRKIKPYLQHQGIELKEYDVKNAELFEILPSKKGASTLRPALVEGETLLLSGRATELER